MPIVATRNNGRPAVAANEFEELGTLGLEAYGGYIQAAYHAAVRWPTCEPLYSRIWRSDPECAIVRQLFSALAGKLRLSWELPEDDTEPNDADRRAVEFGDSVLEDMDAAAWLESAMTRVPFYGFGVWERVAGVRRPDWSAPDDDGWRSQFDDGLVGVRRLATLRYRAPGRPSRRAGRIGPATTSGASRLSRSTRAADPNPRAAGPGSRGRQRASPCAASRRS